MHRVKSAVLGVAVVTASLLLAAPSTVRAQANIAGAWVVSVDSPQGAMTLDTTLPLGDLPVTGTLVGQALTLKFTAQGPQGPLDVTMNGTLTPTGLSGTSSIAGLGESEFSATRVQ